MSHVLLTGGAGFLGAATACDLMRRGYLVTVVDDLSTGLSDRVAHVERFVRLDIRDRMALQALMKHIRPCAVVHLAGRRTLRDALARPEVHAEINVGGTAALLGTVRAAGVRDLVYGSEIGVYGSSDPMQPATEASPLRPTTPRTRQAAEIEALLWDCRSAWGLRPVVLRLGLVAGADPEHRIGETPGRRRGLVPSLVHSALRCQGRHAFEVERTDDKDEDPARPRIVDLIHLSDAAAALGAAVDRRGSPDLAGRAFNASSGQGVGVMELVETMREVSGNDFPTTEVPLRPGSPAALVADPARLTQATGWEPKRSVGEILQSAWKFAHARA